MAGVGFFMQYYSMAIDYPFNAGGRPLNSWPAFIPITFEVMVLVAVVCRVAGDVVSQWPAAAASSGVQRAAFARASQDRFFLCIEAADPQLTSSERPRSWPGSSRWGRGCRADVESCSHGCRKSPIRSPAQLRHRCRRGAADPDGAGRGAVGRCCGLPAEDGSPAQPSAV